jgi:hypothetical protein
VCDLDTSDKSMAFVSLGFGVNFQNSEMHDGRVAEFLDKVTEALHSGIGDLGQPPIAVGPLIASTVPNQRDNVLGPLIM